MNTLMNHLLIAWRLQRTSRATGNSAIASGHVGWKQLAVECLIFGAVYGIAARVGLAYSSLAPNVTLIWAPTGISLFVALRWGFRLWPGIVIGDLIANAGTGVPGWVMLGISAGNVLQTLLCAAALRRVGFHDGLQRVRDVMALLSLGTAAAGLSALIGPGALLLAGSIDSSAYASVGLQWLMGDATGVVVVTPLLLAWWRRGTASATRLWRIEGAALLGVLVLLCAAIFSSLFEASLSVPAGSSVGSDVGGSVGYYPAALALFPLAVWAALRFGLRGATLVTLLVSVAAVWGTVHGLGPFVDRTMTSSLLRWWMFANVITVTSLLLAASQIERDVARTEAIRDRDFSTAVLDAEGSLVVVLDAGWTIRRINRAFETVTGYAQADLLGKRFETALVPEDQRDKFAGHAELLRLHLSDSARHDSQLRRRRGPPITVSWTTSVLRDSQARIAHVIVSGVDVSARVDAAEALRHARRQLEARVAERTRDLAEANADLQVQMTERQRLEREIIRVSEREQQRFGQQLHDGLGQHLTATAIQAELLAGDLQAMGHSDAQQSARHIESMISDAVSQTRLLARGLFPVELEDNGLMAALQELAEGTRRTLRRECMLDCPMPVELRDHTVAIHIYRIAQEAVNNAVKHAPGAPIEISLHHDACAGALRLGIVNTLLAQQRPRASQGAGIGAGMGMGMHIMRHRAQLIGAHIDAGPQDGRWQVRLEVPDGRPAL